ncbi:phosphoglucomutase/phosphomannomutase [Entomoplasma ellychniae]|uniref:Phosphoglucomutase/phosphomannomutase n=1 Tax=Entomoplasma ellychniae TaxID=2114 RepID=A0A8E2QWE0_9MOLU|nr:phospho-sugar mutase [Entomoplasma ellychniae]PPE04917.1 phosphoglucomutase/phosphomannomutase [Entomoplasma ellychniae]
MFFNKENKIYQEWINAKNIDPEVKQELESADESELFATFEGIELEFGTAGIRGILGAGPGRFNIYTIKKVTIAYAKLLIKNYSNELLKGVVVGHDNRHNSKRFAQEVANILSSFNIKAYLFKNNDMQPTPVVSYAVKQLKAIGGVVITASHNPKEYNGYKIYDPLGCQLQDEQTAIISDSMNKIENILKWTYSTKKELIEVVNQKVIDDYIAMIKKLEFYDDVESKKNLTIVFSAVNGTGSAYTPSILRQSGYEVIEVEEHAFEDETFSNVINPNPEFDPAWVIPLQYGKQYNADIIIMNDPDADRFGMFVKVNNEFIRMDGNKTGPLLIDWKLANFKRLNRIPTNPTLYSSFVTSDLGDRVAKEKYGVKIIKTLTGFKWMGREIAKEPINGLHFVFAYEESYGYVIDDSTLDKDGIQASIMIAEMAWYFKKQNLTLVDYLHQIYEEFGYYTTQTLNLNFKPEEKKTKIDKIMSDLRIKPLKQIAGIKVIKIDDHIKGLHNMPGQDLLKYYLQDKSWVAVRPSGTEPKMKIYFVVVGHDAKDSSEKTINIIKSMKEYLNI